MRRCCTLLRSDVLCCVQTLVSVSTVGTFDSLSDAQLEAAVREQLSEWFGASEVASWAALRTYRIPFAQPNQVGGPRLPDSLQCTCTVVYCKVHGRRYRQNRF